MVGKGRLPKKISVDALRPLLQRAASVCAGTGEVAAPEIVTVRRFILKAAFTRAARIETHHDVISVFNFANTGADRSNHPGAFVT